VRNVHVVGTINQRLDKILNIQNSVTDVLTM
jgi:hypothetical protein